MHAESPRQEERGTDPYSERKASSGDEEGEINQHHQSLGAIPVNDHV